MLGQHAKIGKSMCYLKAGLGKGLQPCQLEVPFLPYGSLWFGSKWRKWISPCISTAHISILNNGNPHDFIGSSWDLLQGDPLSPLFFVIVMDVFTKMFSRAIVGGYCLGFWVYINNIVPRKYLTFYSQTIHLIMYDADRNQIPNLGHILLCLEVISSLKVNIQKSKLVAVEEVPQKEELVDILNCSISPLPLKYLVVSLGASFK